MVGLGGVVEHHVEDDLDARRRAAPSTIARNSAAGSAHGDSAARAPRKRRDCSPSSCERPSPTSRSSSRKRPDRHQLDGGDAEPHQMIEHGRLREAQIGAAQRRRHAADAAWSGLGHAPRRAPSRPRRVRPVERRSRPHAPPSRPWARSRRCRADRARTDRHGRPDLHPSSRTARQRPWHRGRAAAGSD